jgi:ferredoxin
MAFVVTEPCFGCKYTDCVVVCPSDCFREGQQMLYIDPESCIDCDACTPECPVQAIYHEDAVPDEWKDFVALNREMAAVCPPIVEPKEPLAQRGSNGNNS